MSESVNLPALGESVTEGTVTRWLKKVGDRVEVDEPLLEVSTDKVDTEIPSPVAGVVEAILVQEDETVEVGTALVTIGDGSGTPPGGGPQAEQPQAEQPQAEQPQAEQPQAEQPQAEQPQAEQASGQGQSEEAVGPSAPAQTPAEVPSTDAPEQAASVTAPQPAPVDPPPAQAPAPTGDTAQSQEVQAQAPSQQGTGYEAPTAEQEAPTEPQPQPQASEPQQQPQTDEQEPQAQAQAPAGETTANEAETSAVRQPSATAGSRAGYVTPLVRKLANQRGIDLSTVTGSGVGGRIRKQDILSADTVSTSPTTTAGPTGTPAGVPEVSALRGTTVPMSRLRKVIAERAVFSMQSSAQLTSVVEVDMTLVAQYRDQVKEEFVEKTGQKLSFLPFFALAATEALQAYPIINATIDGDNIVYPEQENLSIAVDTERGLLTPVVRDAASLDLAGFAAQIADLADRTRENKLKPDELAGGTFTLTNTGSRGALFDTPVVFLPQSAILGTGIVTKRAVVVSDNGGDAIAIRSMVYLALSYDHRIIDGADAARFLVAVKDRLEGGDFASKLGI